MTPDHEPDTTPDASGEPQAEPGAEPVVERVPDPAEGLVSRRGAGIWLVAAGVLVALDGPVGGGVAVLVAAVLLARLPSRLLGVAGVVALAAAPIAVAFRGVPAEDDVSPRFVLRSLLPHHLTFAGLVLVAIWVLIDVRPHLAGVRQSGPLDEGTAVGRVRLPVAIALVAVVAVGALLACRAVLAA